MKDSVSRSVPPVDGPSVFVRLVRAFSFSALFYFLPLALRAELMSDPRIWLVAVVYVVLDLAQPSLKAVKSRQDSDRFSLQVVLTAALLCHVLPVLEWAYLSEAAGDTASLRTASWVTPGMVVGAMLMLLGTAVRIWAIRTLGRFFSVSVELQKKHRLVTQGPYRWVRHPSYTGAVLFLLGVPALLAVPVSLGGCALLLFAAYAYRIQVEERMLGTHFGHEYDAYQSATKRLVPYVW